VAGDLTGDPIVLSALATVGATGREVGDAPGVDGEARRATLHLEVLEVGVAELGEGVIPDRQRPLAQVALAGHREVPGEVEVGAFDPGLA
jgi:hypothetical protein